jgi:L-seryl-tRNA(Ser) seleniumtransferase
MSGRPKSSNSKLRNVPSVDQILRTDVALELRESVGIKKLTAIARSVTSEMRTRLRGTHGNGETPGVLLAEAVRLMKENVQQESRTGIRNVINATGVVLHTNLGRAPLSLAARKAITNEAARYCTLEYDSANGIRGKRGARVESLLCDLTGAEDALVVNNCAAAALLILRVLASDGETVVSRGELVEIGGDFRVPDVMSSSGTRMIEVGTTNRTHLDDYRQVINPHTRLLMRVHPSNYRIVGFASSPERPELVSLARETGVPLYEDAGSGQLSDLTEYGVKDEPIIAELIAQGVDVVSFSGDKLLGAAQAGLIVGKREIVERLRKHPLYRALRGDKLRLVALESTLEAHLKDDANAEIPVLQMLAMTSREIEHRARLFMEQGPLGLTTLALEEGESAVGGGAAPTSKLPTTLISVAHPTRSAQEIEQALRTWSPTIIARISEGKLLIDLRTVFPDQEPYLAEALRNL